MKTSTNAKVGSLAPHHEATLRRTARVRFRMATNLTSRPAAFGLPVDVR